MAWRTLYVLSLVAFVAALPRQDGSQDNLPPARQTLKTDHPIPGVQRIKVRSGPYKVPNMMTPSFPTGVHGMLWNKPDRTVQKPCDGHCTILKQWAGLEYPNGTNANIDSGMWLHHMVHFTSGPTRWDPVCYNKLSLPHTALFLKPNQAERYFSSGNERSVFDFNPGGKDLSKGAGYYLTPQDKFHYLVDLMNMNMDARPVYMTMTYDILPGELPAGWSSAKTVWLDVASCMTSEVPAPQQSGAFEIKSIPWKPNFEGKIIDSIGHLHDGGVAVETLLGSGKKLCRSDSKYSESPEFRFTGSAMGPDKAAKDHISSMTPCLAMARKEDLWLRRDQSLQVIGKYDYGTREGNMENGRQGEIMAITMITVEIPKEGLPRP